MVLERIKNVAFQFGKIQKSIDPSNCAILCERDRTFLERDLEFLIPRSIA